MHKPLRLGISTSCFGRMMPREILEPAYASGIRGHVIEFDDRLNRVMLDFMHDIMYALSSCGCGTVEFYHSMAYDPGPIAQAILDGADVEKWSVHSPYGRYLDPSSPEENVRSGAMEAYCSAVDMAARLGAGVVVAHPGANVEYDVPKQVRLECAAKTLQSIADYAVTKNVKLAVEPLPKQEAGNSLDEVLWILDKIDRPNVGVNFDVNHLFPASAVPDLIRQAGDRILSVHASDQDDNERHWLPFEGKLDWEAVLGALVEVGYSGPLIYETHLQGVDSCGEIVERVVENYRVLSSKIKLTN